MDNIKVKFTELAVKNGHTLPKYMSALAAGMDLHACIEEPFVLKAHEQALISTGIMVALPGTQEEDTVYEAQIRPRSGLAHKYGVTVLNTPGTIDADYTGVVKVILINHSDKDFTINDGDRIAQMVIGKVYRTGFTLVDALEKTERADKGFDSSGHGKNKVTE